MLLGMGACFLLWFVMMGIPVAGAAVVGFCFGLPILLAYLDAKGSKPTTHTFCVADEVLSIDFGDETWRVPVAELLVETFHRGWLTLDKAHSKHLPLVGYSRADRAALMAFLAGLQTLPDHSAPIRAILPSPSPPALPPPAARS